MKTTTFPAAVLAAALALGACASTAPGGPGPAFDRSVVPAPGPEVGLDFPEVQRRTLSSGLGVWVVERPGAPLVTVQLLVDAGAAADPAGQPGIASLTAAMLAEGTARRSAEEIADELGHLAANLSATAGREVATASLTVLERNFPRALEIFADVVANASFPDSVWLRVRDQRLASLLQSADQPATLATDEFHRRLYGPEHPLGRPVDGTPESVRAVTPETLRAFHRRHYRPDNAQLVVVGGVDAAAVVAQLERAFAGWTPGAGPSWSAPADPGAQEATRVYLVDKPGAAQSQIRIGHVGVPRTHRDYFPLLVMNTILGGQFTSRVNLNLREDKGYTYGARSSFQMGRVAGPFTASAGVETAVTRESVVEFMRELEEIRGARPVTAAEVEFARASIVRREPLAMETNAQIAGRVQDLILYGLPLDYFDHYSRQVAAVTVEEVNRVAREHLRPDRFAIVVVGDRSVVEGPLRELPYPVVIVEGVGMD